MTISISAGSVFDENKFVLPHFSPHLKQRYSFHSSRNAASILKNRSPDQFDMICATLEKFDIWAGEIRRPGGSETTFTKRFGDIAGIEGWHQQVHIEADLEVRLLEGKRKTSAKQIAKVLREDFIHNHYVDFWSDRVAFDYEWNSKDQTYDRDLFAFRSFFEAGIIDLGVIVTRDLENDFFASLGHALDKTDTEKQSTVKDKFGASTTGIAKLMSRIEAGRAGGCPVLAIGIKPETVIPDIVLPNTRFCTLK